MNFQKLPEIIKSEKAVYLSAAFVEGTDPEFHVVVPGRIFKGHSMREAIENAVTSLEQRKRA